MKLEDFEAQCEEICMDEDNEFFIAKQVKRKKIRLFIFTSVALGILIAVGQMVYTDMVKKQVESDMKEYRKMAIEEYRETLKEIKKINSEY